MKTNRGLTVREVALLYRVGYAKVRKWIDRGELVAINTAMVLCGNPRWLILPEALLEFERRRASTPPPKPAMRRRMRAAKLVDYYPD